MPHRDSQSSTSEPPFRFRWTRREGWDPGYFDGRIGRWTVAQVTPASTMGGLDAHGFSWELPFVRYWIASLPGPYSGDAATAREAARAAEAAFPRIVVTHQKFVIQEADEDMLRVVLQLPMPAWLTNDFVMRHSRRR